MKKWILVVDDDVETAQALESYLTQHNFPVVLAHSVKEAQQKLRKQEFFCVVTDIRLGEGTGEEIISFVKQKSSGVYSPNVPVIVISGFLEKDLVARIVKQVQGVLVKPFEMTALVEKLKNIKTAA